jgi:hypothetical protein
MCIVLEIRREITLNKQKNVHSQLVILDWKLELKNHES